MSDRLDARELAGIRWGLGQLLVLLSLLGCFSVELGSRPLLLGIFATVGLVTLLPRLIRLIPPPLWRLAPLLLLLVIVGDFFLSGGDILAPLFRMVLLLVLYRSIQARTPREDLQVLLLALFLVLLTGVLSLEITFGLQIIAFTPVAMGLLFVANLSSRRSNAGEEKEVPPILYDEGWTRLFRRIRIRMDVRTMIAGAVLFLTTSALSLLLFILLPRFDIGASIPFPRLQSSQSLVGFSDSIRYGDVVSIINDNAIAMRVDVEMESPPAQPYWRMVVLDAYHDGGFMVSSEVAGRRRTLQNHRFSFEMPHPGGSPPDSVWTLYLQGGISSYLPAGDTFASMRFKNRIDLQVHALTRVFRTNETNASTLSLRYEGLQFGGILPAVAEDLALRGMSPVPVDTSRPAYLRNLSYPQTLLAVPEDQANRRILDRVLEALETTDNPSPREFSARLVAFLQQGRGYSLETVIPPGQGDRVLRWVESGQAGHCELYAGAFVLIARYAGLPTRLVTGYAGGDWNGFENYFMVRNRDAHAWCEVFDPAQGWIRVDPTPGFAGDYGSVEAALAQGRLRLDRTWTAYLDSLRILWFRRVIQFDNEDQAFVAESVRGWGLSNLDWFKDRIQAVRESFSRDWDDLVEHGQWGRLLSALAKPAAFLALVIVLFYSLQKFIKRGSFEGLMRKKAGLILQKHASAVGEESAIGQELMLIRYGPEESWPADTPGALKQLRRLLAGGLRKDSRS